LIGIISAPFLHVGFSHMAADTLGIIISGSLLMLASLKTFTGVTIFVWIFAGFFTWCVARSNFSVVGFGIVNFGWISYLLITPLFQRPVSLKSIALAAVAAILYSGIIFGLFNADPTVVSWESVICSIVAGVLCSVLYWYLWKKYLQHHFAKYLPNIKFPNTPSISSFKSFRDEKNTTPDAEPNAAILVAGNRNSLELPSTRGPAAADHSSPFGSQDQFGNAHKSAYGNSSQPDWLFGGNQNTNNLSFANTPNSNTNINSPSSSSAPAWLIDSKPVEMSPYPPSSSSQTPSQSNFNPFG
jgi:hypothetical protein